MTVLAACAPESAAEPGADPVVIEYSESSGELTLSRSPTEVARRPPQSTSLRFDAIPRAIQDSLPHVSDVASLASGELLILDRSAHRVAVATPAADSIIRYIGRAGDGPGEFSSPVAVAAFDDRFVVLDLHPNKTFTEFLADGQVVETFPAPPGDLFGAVWRTPDVGLERPYQHGPEDWTRRLAMGPDGVRYVQEDDERPYLAETTTVPPRVSLLSFAPGSRAADTVWSGRVERLELDETPVFGANGRRVQTIRARRLQGILLDRPLVAAGGGWSAMRLPGDDAVQVRWPSGDSLRVVWPTRAMATTQLMQSENARLYAKSNDRRRRGGDSGQEPNAARVESIASQNGIWFPDTLPSVSALFASGPCLWMVGADPRAHIDGTGHVLLGVNVDEPNRQPTVLRIEEPEARIRHVAPGHVVVTTRNRFNEVIVSVAEMPSPAC